MQKIGKPQTMVFVFRKSDGLHSVIQLEPSPVKGYWKAWREWRHDCVSEPRALTALRPYIQEMGHPIAAYRMKDTIRR